MTAMLLALASVVLLAAHLTTVGLYLRRLRGRARLPGLIGQPPVTLLRPVCGSDPFGAETLGSSFAQDYPDYRIIFCAPSEGDPAAALVRCLIAAHPGVPATLLTGQVARSGNPKLDNVWKGWDAADTDWICMTDSNVLLPRDYLATMTATWGPDTALVSSPVIGTSPEGFAGSLECAFLNSNQARLQFAADSLGHGFAQGKTLFWNRPMLEQAGGLPILGRFLAEDVSATKFAHGLGRVVSLPSLPAAQPIGRRSLRQVWDRQLRWSRVRRDGFPLLFLGEPVNGAVVPALIAGAAIAAGAPAAALPALVTLWYGAEVVLMRRAGWPCGWRDIAALPIRDLMIPAIWAATFLRRGFEWRGTAMHATDAEPVFTERLP
jgi:ceramide glucosyltransferase